MSQHTAGGTGRTRINRLATRGRYDPIDADFDLDSAVWAGVIPLKTVVQKPIPSANLYAGRELPDYIRDYQPPA